MERERDYDQGVREEAENLCSPFCSKPGRNSPKIDRSFHAPGLTARTVGEFQDRFGQYYAGTGDRMRAWWSSRGG